MSKNIGPLDPNAPLYGQVELNGAPMDVYMDVIEFPEGEKKEVCIDHISDGRAIEMQNDFWLAGCHFPEADEPQVVRMAIVCNGPSMFRRHCRLRLLQAKIDGEVINEGKYC